MSHDEFGREVPDPTPVELPIGFRRPETLQEMMARMIQGELARREFEQGYETFEEANDFEVDDDDPADRVTVYQEMVDEVPARVSSSAGPLIAKPSEATAEARSAEGAPTVAPEAKLASEPSP